VRAFFDTNSLFEHAVLRAPRIAAIIQDWHGFVRFDTDVGVLRRDPNIGSLTQVTNRPGRYARE
jgi:hypothetical protein